MDVVPDVHSEQVMLAAVVQEDVVDEIDVADHIRFQRVREIGEAGVVGYAILNDLTLTGDGH